jgi:glycosyltransferase involved in cell wall biosynthesis
MMTCSYNNRDSATKPLVSVIIVVRNCEKHLAQTISSVIDQTYKNIELIIIDGNSTDGTVDLIRKYETSISNWVSEPDDGIYDAMNKAIKLCKGDYLYFLNCADYFAHLDTLETAVKYLRHKMPDILHGNILCVHEDGVQAKSTQINSEYDLFRETISHQALFTARHVFNTVGVFDKSYRICADREWLLRALKVHKFALTYIDIPICIFDRSGVSSRQRLQLRLENLKINLRHFKLQCYPFLFRQLANKVKSTLAF